ALYALFKLRPLQKKVVMISRQSNKLRPDFEQIGEEIARRDPTVRIVYLCRETGDTPAGYIAYGFHLLHCAAQLSTARVCIVDGYCIPVSMLRHRPELRVIEVWHALGAIKKFGRQALSVPGGRDPEIADHMDMHKNYDCVLCASRRTAEIYQEAFGVSRDKLRVIGVPRVDAILKMDRSRCRRRFYAAYPELRGRKNILYVPTFRDGGMPELEPVLRAAREADVNLIVRLHPLDRERLQKHPELPPFMECEKFGTFTLMAAADAVITDYSAISIEASLIRKPVYFYVYDVDEYAETRGLNFNPLAEMPHCASKDFGTLLHKILNEPYDFEKLEAFRREFVETCDRNNVARIVNLIFRYMRTDESADVSCAKREAALKEL
ncbi:MAG: CDP-glycerol glycerophosphotransferase family protein, partial [Hominenteromicrobium sp.]